MPASPRPVCPCIPDKTDPLHSEPGLQRFRRRTRRSPTRRQLPAPPLQEQRARSRSPARSVIHATLAPPRESASHGERAVRRTRAAILPPPPPTCLPAPSGHLGLGQETGAHARTHGPLSRRDPGAPAGAEGEALTKRPFVVSRSLTLSLHRLHSYLPPFTVLPPDSRRRDIYSRSLPARHHRRSLDPLPGQLALSQL